MKQLLRLSVGAGMAWMAVAQLFAGTVSLTFPSVLGSFGDSNGDPLATGSLVRLGTIAGSTPQEIAANRIILTTATDFATANPAFLPLAEGFANAGSITQSGNSSSSQLIINTFAGAGSTNGSLDDWTSSYMAEGTPLFLWVFNSTDASGGNSGTVETADFAAATEWGIFGSTKSSWLLPSDGFGGITNLVGSDLVTGTGDAAVNSDFIVGSTGLTGGAQPQIRLYDLDSGIPEPSSLLLTVLSAGLLLLRRGRRRE